MGHQSKAHNHSISNNLLSNNRFNRILGSVLLSAAVTSGNPTKTKLLIEAGARLLPPSMLDKMQKQTGFEWYKYRHSNLLNGPKHWVCLSIIYKSDFSFRKHCFYQAVMSSDCSWLTNIVQAGQDINTLHPLGITALNIAKKHKMHKMVSILEKYGAKDSLY